METLTQKPKEAPPVALYQKFDSGITSLLSDLQVRKIALEEKLAEIGEEEEGSQIIHEKLAVYEDQIGKIAEIRLRCIEITKGTSVSEVLTDIQTRVADVCNGLHLDPEKYLAYPSSAQKVIHTPYPGPKLDTANDNQSDSPAVAS